ncbi:hypothetical protein HW554_18905, partial [Hymenobacter sp. P5342]|nr:hypothetical protein [Hymenobacter lapidiphilus]
MATYDELLQRGAGVRDETAPSANTAPRIGQLLIDIVATAKGAPFATTTPALLL